MTRPVCEAPTPAPGLCGVCYASPALRSAYHEGRDRRAGYEPLAALQPMTDAVAEVVAHGVA